MIETSSSSESFVGRIVGGIGDDGYTLCVDTSRRGIVRDDGNEDHPGDLSRYGW